MSDATDAELTALRNRLDEVVASGNVRPLLRLADGMLALARRCEGTADRLDHAAQASARRGTEFGRLLRDDDMRARAGAYRDCARDLREAITTALLKEG